MAAHTTAWELKLMWWCYWWQVCRILRRKGSEIKRWCKTRTLTSIAIIIYVFIVLCMGVTALFRYFHRNLMYIHMYFIQLCIIDNSFRYQWIFISVSRLFLVPNFHKNCCNPSNITNYFFIKMRSRLESLWSIHGVDTIAFSKLSQLSVMTFW